MDSVLSSTVSQLMLLVLPVALTIAALGFVTRLNARLVIRLLGYDRYIKMASLTAILHEASHAVAGLLFFHKIVEFSIFSFDPKTCHLGHVTHSYNRKSLYQMSGNLFIGIAPYIVGVLLFVLVDFLMGDRFAHPGYLSQARIPVVLSNIPAILQAVVMETGQTVSRLLSPSNLLNMWWYLYLVIAVILGNMMAPSLADLKSSAIGAINVALILLVINVVLHALGETFTPFINYLVTVIFGILHVTAVIIFINSAFSLLLLLAFSLISLLRQRRTQ
jgi:hypothetical protein